MKVSVVVPSKYGKWLRYLLMGLSWQVLKPDEVVFILKDCDFKGVEALSRRYRLNYVIVEQKKGYFTSALNLGKCEASGDIIIFTDDDAIPPKHWIYRYVKLYQRLQQNVGCVSSRDFLIDLNYMKVTTTKDDAIKTKAYRWIIRPLLEPSLPALKKYRFGVYISKKLDVVHGPFLPDRACYSLPYRGVNMSFRKEAIQEVKFPEHPYLKRALGNEQYLGLQLIIKGWDLIYTPNNPILHIHRNESLSRVATKKQSELKQEVSIMKALIKALL